jgi:hypothetical protein
VTYRSVTLAEMRVVLARAVVILWALVPQVALAAGGPSTGVHVDPGSPAGKQYAIPITSARGETSDNLSGSGSANPPLFGSGVTPPSSGGASATTTGGSQSPRATDRPLKAKRSSRGSAVRGAARRSRRATESGPSPAPPPSTDPPTQSNVVGGSTWLPLAGGGALVLLLGCGTGFALRRRL